MKAVIDERLLNRIRGIKLLILDVDGVMTDGRIIIDDAGLESKQFNVRDGHGLKMLMRCGIDVVLLTGKNPAQSTTGLRIWGLRKSIRGYGISERHLTRF